MTASQIMWSTNWTILCLFCILLCAWSTPAKSSLLDDLKQLQQAYPEYIKSYNERFITWKDGTQMSVQDDKTNKSMQEKIDSPSLADQLEQDPYPAGMPANVSSFHPIGDPGRIRYEPFFRKMYGNSVSDVSNKLVSIYWMPKIVGKKQLLSVTTVNAVNKKLSQISDELEKLVNIHPEYIKYLKNIGGTFNWRFIAGTNRVSSHSFGIAIDLNPKYSNYWRSDLTKQNLPAEESTPLTYKNQIPWEIVLIFEKYGFIWGGKWYHYDTMHFEYRPELLPHHQ